MSMTREVWLHFDLPKKDHSATIVVVRDLLLLENLCGSKKHLPSHGALIAAL